DTYGGKSHIERRWGTTFINVAGLTRYHGPPANNVPRSWLVTFTDGSDEVSAQCYLHGNEFASQGFYPKSSERLSFRNHSRCQRGKVALSVSRQGKFGSAYS